MSQFKEVMVTVRGAVTSNTLLSAQFVLEMCGNGVLLYKSFNPWYDHQSPLTPEQPNVSAQALLYKKTNSSSGPRKSVVPKMMLCNELPV